MPLGTWQSPPRHPYSETQDGISNPIRGLGASVRTTGATRFGWKVHAFDRGNRRLLGRHIDRGNMGFDLPWLRIDTGEEGASAKK